MLSRIICRRVVSISVCALASLFAARAADAAPILVTTGHTGAQVQVDVDHTQYWTFNVASDVSDVIGGLFTMKVGPHTSENIEFDIYEGTYGTPLGSDLLSVILGPSSFTQSYAPVEFAGSPISLLSGHTFTAVLWSNAVDAQSDAYFIKGGSDALGFTDPNGSPVPAPAPVPGVATGVPLPLGAPAAGIAILAGAMFRAFRRKLA